MSGSKSNKYILKSNKSNKANNKTKRFRGSIKITMANKQR